MQYSIPDIADVTTEQFDRTMKTNVYVLTPAYGRSRTARSSAYIAVMELSGSPRPLSPTFPRADRSLSLPHKASVASTGNVECETYADLFSRICWPSHAPRVSIADITETGNTADLQLLHDQGCSGRHGPSPIEPVAL